ncbi:MAG: winged helix-turn-helix transcriptional regulator [Deltaproteobacteria bacterium]|nr:winged helix-turn-helix transcriptional regulator [Deltaproteobacteria bacterium]MBW2130826.1 winged helix-turn-helix transcriptional regulator [Deltaproteobacteria bacterium]MBW2304811.1 winged helix-turn-helix transcriptional regulator [Deltaproteobacteria bacterium]
MIKPFYSQFLTPTKKFRRLSVLLSVHDSPRISQHRIGELTHLSSSMVNNYVKEFQAEGLLKVSGKTNRTQSYHLTPRGRKELISLLLDYSAEIIRLYTAAKHEVGERLDNLANEGIKTIGLFGAAETAEVVHAATKGTGIKVVAVVDSDPEKQGRAFNGLTIQAPEVLKELDADALVITSFGKQQEIYQQIKEIAGDTFRIIRLSDL